MEFFANKDLVFFKIGAGTLREEYDANQNQFIEFRQCYGEHNTELERHKLDTAVLIVLEVVEK